MATIERAHLHAQLSQALEASLGEAWVYNPVEACLAGHETRDPEYGTYESAIGELCAECVSDAVWRDYTISDDKPYDPEAFMARYDEVKAHAPAEWRIGRGEPVNWDAWDVLGPRWERWTNMQMKDDVIAMACEHRTQGARPWTVCIDGICALGETLPRAWVAAWIDYLEDRAEMEANHDDR